MELDAKTVLLTGATGGLGRAIAQALAERRATLVLSSRKGPELEEMTAALPGEGHRFVVADLAEDGAGERVVAEAGDVDVLVANAGLWAGGRLDRYSEDDLVSALHVNLEVPVRMARAVLPGMVERGDGHLVFISSLQGKVA